MPPRLTTFLASIISLPFFISACKMNEERGFLEIRYLNSERAQIANLNVQRVSKKNDS